MKVEHFADSIGPLMLPYVGTLLNRKCDLLQRVAVLISGSGTNLQVIKRFIQTQSTHLIVTFFLFFNEISR